MGWASRCVVPFCRISLIAGSHTLERSADYVQGVRMNFKTKEDAIHFAEKQGERLCV